VSVSVFMKKEDRLVTDQEDGEWEKEERRVGEGEGEGEREREREKERGRKREGERERERDETKQHFLNRFCTLKIIAANIT
jgi:RNA-binding motif X-linked protein 2